MRSTASDFSLRPAGARGGEFPPWFGVLAWTTATLIGIGAALSTKFGRREPWFELA